MNATRYAAICAREGITVDAYRRWSAMHQDIWWWLVETPNIGQVSLIQMAAHWEQSAFDAPQGVRRCLRSIARRTGAVRMRPLPDETVAAFVDRLRE